MLRLINKISIAVFALFCGLIVVAKLCYIKDSVCFFVLKTTNIEATTLLSVSVFALLALTVPFLAILIYKLFYVLRRSSFFHYIEEKSTVSICIFIFFASFLTRILSVIIFKSDFTVHKDMGNAYDFAVQLSKSGVIKNNADYAMSYGRYVNMALIFVPVFKIFGASTTVVSVSLSTLFSMAYVAWFDVLKKKTNKTRALFTVAVLSILINEICLVNLLLHEAFLFFSITAFVWLVYCVCPRMKSKCKKYSMFVVACIVLSIGTLCNPMGYIAVIAFCLAPVFKLLKNKFTFEGLKKTAACVFVLIFVLWLVSQVALCVRSQVIEKSSINYAQSTERKVPLGWSLYVGGSYEHSGQWSLEDYKAYYPDNSDVPKSGLYDYRIGLLKDRYSRYIQNPLDYFSHLFNKIKVTYGANTYAFEYAYAFSRSDNFPRALFLVIYMTVSIPMLFFSFYLLLSVSVKHTSDSSLLFLLRNFLNGSFLVLLFVETTTKYVSCFWALMFFVLCIEWGRASARLQRFMNALTNINKRMQFKTELK